MGTNDIEVLKEQISRLMAALEALILNVSDLK